MAELTGYCVKCGEKDVTMDDVSVERTKNGRAMAKGVHSDCGTTVTKFLSEDDAKKFE